MAGEYGLPKWAGLKKSDPTPLIEGVQALPCFESHDNEVYAVFGIEHDADAFPGDDAIYELASSGCLEHFESFVGRHMETRCLISILCIPPEKADRSLTTEVIFAVYHMEGEKLPAQLRVWDSDH